MGRIAALDHGTRRIGVAVSDPIGLTAQPTGFIPSGPGIEERLRNLAEEWDVELFVVGLPTSLDGSEGAAARAAREFAELVGEVTGVPVAMTDERFSTVVAERALLEGGASRSRRREARDGVAAAVFLQGYLDARS